MRRAAGLGLGIAVALSTWGCQPRAQSSPGVSAPSVSSPVASETPAPAVTGRPAPSGLSVDLAERVANRPAGGDPGLIGAIPEVRVIASWTIPLLDAPGGRQIDPGGATQTRTGLALAVLGEPVDVAGRRWLKAFALPNQQYGPAGYFGWIPADPDGTGKTLGVATPCPIGDTGIAGLAALDPFTRARCLGPATFDLEGYAGDYPLPVWSDVDPLWLGHPQDGRPDSTFSLHAEPVTHAYFEDGPSLDLQLPPGMERPPWGFKIAVRAHVADATSASCHRTVPPDLLDAGTESTADSVLWCSTRLVVERWTPLLGPEGRPIDPSAPQLHRHPASGANAACAGVGMPPLTFHVDPSALDPVWLRVSGAPAGHIVASFDPTFHAIYTPELVVVDGAGHVVVRDGTPLDPDGTLAGHWICPMGSVVSIDAFIAP